MNEKNRPNDLESPNISDDDIDGAFDKEEKETLQQTDFLIKKEKFDYRLYRIDKILSLSEDISRKILFVLVCVFFMLLIIRAGYWVWFLFDIQNFFYFLETISEIFTGSDNVFWITLMFFIFGFSIFRIIRDYLIRSKQE